MKPLHMPQVDARYWLTITMASLLGTNLGDLYAHTLKLGVYRGVAVLAVLAAGVFLAEKRDQAPRLLWYWLVIIIIRTGATNIADWLAFKVRVPEPALCLGLAAVIAVGGALSLRGKGEGQGMPDTGVAYWVAMLGAGVFGTALGDVCSDLVGQGLASLALGAVLLLAVAVWHLGGGMRLMLYWLVVAVARTAGTAMGDFLAESRMLGLGLPVATCITGALFILCTSIVRPGAVQGEAEALA